MASNIFEDKVGIGTGTPGAVHPMVVEGRMMYLVEEPDGRISEWSTVEQADVRSKQILAAANGATGKSLGSITDPLYGTPDEIRDYKAGGTPDEIAAWNQSAAARASLGVSPDTVFTRNGQTLSAPAPYPKQPLEPGALAAQNREAARIRAQQAGNVTDYTGKRDQIVSDLGTAYGGYDASGQEALDAFLGSSGGISAPTSDPAAREAQMQALGILMGAAGGSMDVSTNPEDLQRQKQAAAKLWGLTDPEMTANERFLQEQFRGAEERDTRAAMNGALRQLSSQGMLGSGGQIGAMLGSQQTTSQNRLMGDLGAQAQAVQRAMNALGLYTNLSTSMRNSSDAMSTGNADRRLGGAQAAGNVAGQGRSQSFAESSAATDLAKWKANSAFDATNQTTMAAQGRTDKLADAKATAASSAFDASSGLSDLDQKLADAEFQRTLDALGWNWKAQTTAEGADENRKAAAALGRK